MPVMWEPEDAPDRFKPVVEDVACKDCNRKPASYECRVCTGKLCKRCVVVHPAGGCICKDCEESVNL